MDKNISRRRFLKNSAATSVSLIIGLNSKGILATNKTNTVINPFVRMDQKGFVTVIAKHFENGQGISTGLATLLAEEMDADWEKVKSNLLLPMLKNINTHFGVIRQLVILNPLPILSCSTVLQEQWQKI